MSERLRAEGHKFEIEPHAILYWGVESTPQGCGTIAKRHMPCTEANSRRELQSQVVVE